MTVYLYLVTLTQADGLSLTQGGNKMIMYLVKNLLLSSANIYIIWLSASRSFYMYRLMRSNCDFYPPPPLTAQLVARVTNKIHVNL